MMQQELQELQGYDPSGRLLAGPFQIVTGGCRGLNIQICSSLLCWLQDSLPLFGRMR